MTNRRGDAAPLPDRARALRSELARMIALFMGSAENRATDIPGLTLHRRNAPTTPSSVTYHPSIAVVAPGAEAGRPRPNHFHLRGLAIPTYVDRLAGRQSSDRGE